MTIGSLIAARPHDIISIDAGARVAEAVALLAERRIGAVPVTRAGAVVGIVSERDILYMLASDGAAMLDRPVEQAMSAPPITIAPDVSILSALSLMTKRRIRHLPVMDGDVMRGFVSIGDLVKARIDRIESEAEAMRSYIQSS